MILFRKNMMIKYAAKKILFKNPRLSTFVCEINFKRKHKQDFSAVPEYELNIIKEIQKNSIYIIPNFVDEDFCKKCREEIDNLLIKHKEFVQEYSDLRIFGAEELSDIINQFATHKFLNKFANYYNTDETCNAFTLANRIEFNEKSKKLGSGGGWHRDSLYRQVKAILYLNDVNEKNGAYQIIKNSHKLRSRLQDIGIGGIDSTQVRFSDQQVEKIIQNDPSRLITVKGKAGTLILKDCSAIHRGSPLKEGIRYALTNYFLFKSELNAQLIKHFSPVVSPEKILRMGSQK